MTSFRCPQCNNRLKVLPEQAGQVVRCPHCQTRINIPAEPPGAGDRVATHKAPHFDDASENIGKDPSLARRATDNTPHFEDASEASLSRPSQEINHEELIDMTAMVDIVFFLLIFFLVTSMSAIQSSAPLPRPENSDDENGAAAAQRIEDPQKDPNAIIVKINKDDLIEIDGVPYREITDLVIRLRQLRMSGGSDASMLVVGHGEASHGAAVSVLDSGYEVGFDHVRLAVLGDTAE